MGRGQGTDAKLLFSLDMATNKKIMYFWVIPMGQRAFYNMYSGLGK